MKYILVFILSISLLLSCKNYKASSSNSNNMTKSTSQSSDNNAFHKELKSGKLNFTIDSDNKKKSKITISITGLEKANYKETFEKDAIVDDAILRDLNMDNNIELYILMTLNDESGNKDLMAIGSNNNKSASEISIQKIYDKKNISSDNFILSTPETLQRQYQNIEGKTVFVNYVLVEGESSYRLIPNMRTK